MKIPIVEFKKYEKSNPNLSSFICFGQFIQGRGLTKFYLKKWMKALIDPEDYSESDFDLLVEHFHNLRLQTNDLSLQTSE